jgi:outer membrane protein assembly factor BamE (lipoprotein component of BamABCDE complex)
MRPTFMHPWLIVHPGQMIRRLTIVACLVLSGCSWLMNPPQLRGNKIDSDQMQELTPGVSTKADVTAVVGSPTAHDSFDDNVWLYISEMTQSRIGRTLGETQQHVIVMTFDQAGVLRTIDEKDKADALPVRVVSRTTPSPGTEASFLQQLLGNIGRFNPGGALGSSGGGGSSAGGSPTGLSVQ